MDIHGVQLGSVAAARHIFNDRGYYVSMSVENEDLLKIQVEDEDSGEQWVGKYGANCKFLCFLLLKVFVHKMKKSRKLFMNTEIFVILPIKKYCTG